MSRVKRAVVQASSRSWAGSPDESVALFEGKPQFIHSLKRLSSLPVDSLAVMAPAFDRDGALDGHLETHFDSPVPIIYAHDASPLRRCLDACADLGDDDYVLRLNGANFSIPDVLFARAFAAVDERHPDLVKLPDDYPGTYQFEISRVGALRAIAETLDSASPLNIHPRYLLARCAAEVVTVEAAFEEIREDLARTREIRTRITLTDFHDVDIHSAIPIADQISYHYTLALAAIRPPGLVFDIACGSGHGAYRLAEAGFRVHGADINTARIEAARARFTSDNLTFDVMDGDDITLASESCDYIVSFETVEHVSAPHRFIKELRRILKPGGILCISTPQNRFGQIPTTPSHAIEFSYRELSDLVSASFEIVDFKGLKAGTVHFPHDPIGANSFVVARR